MPVKRGAAGKAGDRGQNMTVVKEALQKVELGRVLRERGDLKDAIAALDRAKELMAQANASDGDRMRLFVEMAQLSIKMVDLEKARVATEEAMGLIGRPGMPASLKAEALLAHGTYLTIKGDPVMAIRDLERAMALFEAARDNLGIATTCRNIGNIHRSNSQLGKAQAYFRRAYNLYKEVGAEEESWAVRHNMANATADSGLYDDALKEFGLCLEHFESVKNRRNITFALSNIGNTLIRMGKWDEAIRQLDRCWSVSEELGRIGIWGSIVCLKCEGLVGKGELEAAKELMDKHFDGIIGGGGEFHKGSAYRTRGLINREKGEFENAEMDFRQGEKVFSKAGYKTAIALLYIEWAKLKLRTGDRSGSKRIFGKARTMFKELKLPLLEKELDETIGRCGM